MPPHIDSSAASVQPVVTPVGSSGPHLNALKHGFYSAGILLPGDDAEAFRRERLALFHLYRPQTIREAKLVDQMAQWQWQLDRSGPLQARCDEQALEPAADAADRVTEPLAHRRLHTTMDVTLHRLRLDRAVRRNEKDLLSLQKLRRMGLVEGAVKLPPGCYLERSGEIAAMAAPVPEKVAACQLAQEAPGPAAAGEASGSEDGGNGNGLEQKETGQGSPRWAGLPEWPTRREGAPDVAAADALRLPPGFSLWRPAPSAYSVVSSL